MEQNTRAVAEKEVDFKVTREDYCRYQLEDGTLLKVKMCVLKIGESLSRGPGGYPKFGFQINNVVTTLVPDRLRSAPSTRVVDLNTEPAKEIGFTVQENEWQEYELVDGFLVRIKPVVTKIFKYDAHNGFGEPIYSVPNIQHIQDVIRVGPERPPVV